MTTIDSELTLEPTDAIFFTSVPILSGTTSEVVATYWKRRDGDWADGKLLKADDFEYLIHGVGAGGDIDPHEIPENLLYFSQSKMRWWAKKRRCEIFFTDLCKSKKRMWDHPAILFEATPGNLKLWGLEENKRPNNESQLIQLGYRGVDVHTERNQMASCRVNLPEVLNPQDIPKWEDAFYFSRFNQEPQATTKSNKRVKDI